MKRKITILFTALTVFCSQDVRIFEPQQIDLIYNEVFWKTQTDAEVGLSGVYALYRGLMVSAPTGTKEQTPQPVSLKEAGTGAHLPTFIR
jgi:hypothetical protein